RSRLNGVRLTTVSHPKALIGVWAATLLREQFEQTDNKPIYRKITVHSSMVYRETVAAPRVTGNEPPQGAKAANLPVL
ncbi:MAG: hypothetical protein LBB72_03570, partial [Spirochaetaceae bacterium]|nr:hypothetical protein [Spirochaetaceae bacterium]